MQMIYYRKSQNELLAMDSDQEKMRQYLSMKTQSAYIDGYTRDLLHTRMEQGGQQWQQISTANGHRTRQLLTFLIIITLMVCVVLMIFSPKRAAAGQPSLVTPPTASVSVSMMRRRSRYEAGTSLDEPPDRSI